MSAPLPPSYVVPVVGVRPGDLRSSFGAARSAGRRHEGIDIMARRGTPIVAAADGIVMSTRPNRLGGTVVWIMGAGGRTYYYAHLDSIAPSVRVGRFIGANEAVGTVGNTGNAKGGPPHLHFGVYERASRVLPGPSKALDPYLILRAPLKRATPIERADDDKRGRPSDRRG